MATFRIVGSRRLGPANCEFDVIVESGSVAVGELFPIEERGSLWEYIILSVEQRSDVVTLGCVTWIPTSGAFVGLTASTRAMKAVDKKHYAKVLPDNLRI